MGKKTPKFDKLQVYVEHQNTVLITWHDTLSSGNIRLTAEEAMELGRWGKTAYIRRTGELPEDHKIAIKEYPDA